MKKNYQCDHCAIELDDYEKDCKYCLPCFDLAQKVRKKVIGEVELIMRSQIKSCLSVNLRIILNKLADVLQKELQK